MSPGDSIQAAVDAAGPDDVIAVEDGVYDQGVEITRTRNLTLLAADGATPVLNGSALPRGETIVELAPQNDTAIQGLRIEGFRFEDAPSHSGGSFTSGHGLAMFTDDIVNDVAVVDNTFDNTGTSPPSDHEGAGIVLDNVDGLLIENNVLRGVARDGSPIGFGTTLDQKAAITIHDYDDDNDISDVVVRGNTIVNVTRGMWIGGIAPASNARLDDVTVVDNSIEDVLREGIRAEVAAPAGDGRLLVKDNDLIGADAAIRVNGGEVVIRDLLVRGAAPDYGIAADDHYGIGLEDGGDVTVRNADIADQEDDGVKVLNGNLTLRDSTVHGNPGDALDVRDPTLRLDSVDVGDGTLSGRATQVTVDEATSWPSLPTGTTAVGVFNATNRSADGYLNATVTYTPGDEVLIDESTLDLHRYDEASENWTSLGAAVDATGNAVTANLTSFSTFAAFGDALGTGDSDSTETGPSGPGGPDRATDGTQSNDGEPSEGGAASPVTTVAEPSVGSSADDVGGPTSDGTDAGGGGDVNESTVVREPDDPGVLRWFWPLLAILVLALIVASRRLMGEDEE